MKLTRQQRRALERQKQSTATYNITSEQLDALGKEMYKKALDEAVLLAMVLPVWTLRNKFQMGNKRLHRFVEALNEEYKYLEADYISILDMLEQLEEETGITLGEENGNYHFINTWEEKKNAEQ